tara:strand:+ start:101 stop:559 length:459 start_codon:yes stop_codon:yes gene_type:complete
MKNERIDLTQFESKQQEFTDYLQHNDLPDNNWFIEKYPETCYEFQEHVKEAYGNGDLTGGQGDYCCLVFDIGPDNKDAYVTLKSEETEPGLVEYYLSIEESRKEPTHNGRPITRGTLIAELKRCYEELDVLEELLRTGLMDEEIYNQVKASM